MLGGGGQMGLAGGGQDAVMAENLLHFEQIDARLNQMRGIN
jgi:hypothetical protein